MQICIVLVICTFWSAVVSVIQRDPEAKRIFHLAALANQGPEKYKARFSPTFTKFLNDTVGPLFEPPISFIDTPLTFDVFLDEAEQYADFTYTHPSLYACVAYEMSFSAVTTLQSLRRDQPLSVFGGTILTLADRDDINTLQDIKGKRVSSVSLSSLGGHQMQALEALYAGINLFRDAEQMILMGTPQDALRALLRKESEVAFLRTDVLESLVAAGELALSDIKVLNQQFHVLPDGTPFPFIISTRLYPEWAFAANPATVDVDIQKAVAKALFSIAPDSEFATTGQYRSWQPPAAYLETGHMLIELGLLTQIRQGSWKCARTADIYNGIVCPENWVPLSRNATLTSCIDAGLPCPESARDCLCRPCRPACQANAHLEDDGSCSCDCNFYDIRGTCVHIDVIMIFVFVPLAGLIVIALLAYGRIVAARADRAWHINAAEIKVDDPPEVLGNGTFGIVIRCEFRGQLVAVKRILPLRMPKRRSKAHSVNKRQSKAKLRQSAANFQLYEIAQAPEARLHAIFDQAILGLDDGNETSHRRGASSTRGRDDSWWTNFMSSTSKEKYIIKQRRRRFVQEMRLIAKLRHRNIVQVLGVVLNNNDPPLLVMENMELGSLHDVLHNETMELSGEMTYYMIRDLCSGMRYLHECKPAIVHGDLKSANALIDAKWYLKITDFGEATSRPDSSTGTLLWMAPECIKGSNSSMASDVYSFSICLYEILTRKEPYYNSTDFEQTIKDIVRKRLRPAIPSTAPKELIAIANECWSSDATQRPTFSELDRRMNSFDASIFPMPKLKASAGDALLECVFPKHVAEALKEGRKVQAEHFDQCTIFFSDIVGFTDISSSLPPEVVMDMLDRLYTQLDRLVGVHDLFKVETIGDAFMCVSNLHKQQPTDHVKRIAEFSIDAIKAANATMISTEQPEMGTINLRVGFHTGPVVANVVGTKNPRYCLFGDTVNTASRMESNSEKNRIHMSDVSKALLRKQAPGLYELEERGMIPIKGKGKMATAFLVARTSPVDTEPREQRHSQSMRRRISAVSIDVGDVGDVASTLEQLPETHSEV